VWRRVRDAVEVLLLHRHETKGDFWQPVCGQVEEDESLLEAVEREIEEETSLIEFEVDDDVFFKFTFDKDYLTGKTIEPVTEHVFSAELQSDGEDEQEVNITRNFSDEHDMFRWVSVEDALRMLKWNDNKVALSKFVEKYKVK